MLVSSVPLSLTIILGFLRPAMIAVSSRVTRILESKVFATSARHSRLKSPTLVQIHPLLHWHCELLKTTMQAKFLNGFGLRVTQGHLFKVR